MCGALVNYDQVKEEPGRGDGGAKTSGGSEKEGKNSRKEEGKERDETQWNSHKHRALSIF